MELHAQETVGSLKQSIAHCLPPGIAASSWHVYTTPPKQVQCCRSRDHILPDCKCLGVLVAILWCGGGGGGGKGLGDKRGSML